MITALITRNIRIFFRDKMNVFFAMLSSLIMFVLYVFFLGQLQVDGIKELLPGADSTAINYFVNSWVFAGILTITTITTGLAALQVFVADRASGRFNDFSVSPIAKWKLVLSYLVSTFVIAMGLTTIMLVISELYIVAQGGAWLSLSQLGLTYAYLMLSTLAFSAISSFLATFIKTEAAFSSLGIIIGTSVGFLAGVYVPLGTLPVAVGNVMNTLPYSQSASLVREPFTNDALRGLADNNPQVTEQLRQSFGVDIALGDTTLNTTTIVTILFGVSVTFGVLAVQRLSRKLQ